MTSQSAGPRRVRRPKQHRELLERLQQSDSAFRSYRDILLFAAGVGYSRQRREPFEETDETIRWDVLVGPPGSEAFVNMLALSEEPDPTLLADDRFEDRILIFEEFANGGLGILGDLLQAAPMKEAIEVLRTLVAQASDQDAEAENEPVDITDVLIGDL